MKQTTPWCNGSTTGFGPVSLGSNPGGVAIFFANMLQKVKKWITSKSIPNQIGVFRTPTGKISKSDIFTAKHNCCLRGNTLFSTGKSQLFGSRKFHRNPVNRYTGNL